MEAVNTTLYVTMYPSSPVMDTLLIAAMPSLVMLTSTSLDVDLGALAINQNGPPYWIVANVDISYCRSQ